MFNIKRFLDAQAAAYEQALAEIKRGRKTSHWMWYIFPQLKGLGRSRFAKYYGIESLEEAKEYFADEVLRQRLVEITKAFYGLDGDPYDILGSPDHWKMKSCMTLFDIVCPNSIFNDVLEKFYQGKRCHRTLTLLNPSEAESRDSKSQSIEDVAKLQK